MIKLSQVKLYKMYDTTKENFDFDLSASFIDTTCRRTFTKAVKNTNHNLQWEDSLFPRQSKLGTQLNTLNQIENPFCHPFY